MAQIVTITNPLTGQPAQVDQLDHTAQQIDDGLNIARGVSNPNLLDNWYFGNPVDQRGGYVVPPGTAYTHGAEVVGTTTQYYQVLRTTVNASIFQIDGVDCYTETVNTVRGYTGAGYGIDRWKGYDSGQVVLIYNDHISIKHGATNGIIEFLDNGHFASLSNKTMTLSFLLMNNILLVYTFTTGSSERWYNTEIDGYRMEFGHTATPYVMITSANDIDVKAAKLELGTEQTLAHQDSSGKWVLNEIPDYGEQLRRCQRYFYRWPYLVQYLTLAANGGFGMADFQFPVTMRTIPTITNIAGTNTDLSTFSVAAGQGGVHFQNTGTDMVSITNFDAVADL